MHRRITLCVLLSVSQILGFVPATPAHRNPHPAGVLAGRTPRALAYSAGLCCAQALDQTAASAALAETHKQAQTRLVAAGFAPNTFAADLGFGSGEFQVEIAGRVVGGSVTSFRGLHEQRQTWASALVLEGDGFARYALQAWNGPEIDVPNLYVSATASSDGIDLHLDLRPRLDAAYDQDPDAPPTTREGFVRIANRNRYDQVYYTAEARAATASLVAAGKNFAPPVDVVQGRATDKAGLISGPLLVNARFPLTEQSLAQCCTAVTDFVHRYCTWMAEAEAVPWVTTRILYDRDCQVRLTLYQKAAKEYGVDLAAADAGEMGMVGHNRLGLGRGD